MATKLLKRTKRTDVFDDILEEAGSLATDDRQTGEDTTTPKDDDGPNIGEADDDTIESVTQDEDDDADDGQAHQMEHSPRKRWVRYAVAGVAGVLFISALSLAGFLGWQLKQERDIDSASRAALAAAQHFTVALTSIDSNKVDQNFAEVVDGSTGQFKDMYSQSASQLRQVLIDNRAMSKGTVIDSSIKSAAKTKVQVLLFVDQWIINEASPQPRMDRSRVAMTMELVDGRWLASDVELK